MAKSLHPVCVFCNSLQLEIRFSNSYHPLKKNYGPFNIYTCHHCHSLITFPLPTEKQLAELYNSFDNGLMPALREIRNKNSLTAWYDQCIKRATAAWANNKQSEFVWMDIGAGGGELALQMAKQFPHSKGWAIDFHERPELDFVADDDRVLGGVSDFQARLGFHRSQRLDGDSSNEFDWHFFPAMKYFFHS